MKPQVLLMLAPTALAGALLAAQYAGGDPLTGIWRCQGYGELLRLEEHGGTLYEETSVSLLPVQRVRRAGDRLEFEESFRDGTVHFAAGRLELRADALERLRVFDRIASLPPESPAGRDPERAFEIFWRSFEEHYAFFDLRGVDWPAVYREHRPRVSARTTDQELTTVLRALVSRIDDAHTWVETGGARFSGYTRHALSKRRLELRGVVEKSYLASEPLRAAAAGSVLWGRLRGGAGYLALTRFAGHLEGRSEIEDLVGQRAALERGVDQALGELQAAPALVVDVRWNGGGFDDFARAAAARLADRRRPGYSKRARRVGVEAATAPLFFEIAPAPRSFTGPVALLTSRMTGSGAEIFVLSTMAFPHILRVGEPTGGWLSDVLERRLPNGWRFGLSNEIYLGPDGELYESRGIPPHQQVPLLTKDLDAGRDRILEEALRQVEVAPADAMRGARARRDPAARPET